VEYSPTLRTALVLSGTGAHGAYQAGALKALLEAGVKIDLVAGHGVGAAAAALAAIDGTSALWDEKGIWRGQPARLYGWRIPVAVTGRMALGLMAALIGLVAALVLQIPVPVGVLYALLALVVITTVVFVVGGELSQPRIPGRRRRGQAWRWGLAGAPFDVSAARSAFANAIWQLVRGAAPSRATLRDVGRRYGEVLSDSLGQPGVRELMILATDLDARQDVVAALLREPFRQSFFAPRPARERQAEALDLAGAGRDHALDIVCGALTPSFGAEPHLVTFSPNSYWRGETHRLCDRAGAMSRLLEELELAGIDQVIIVTAVETRIVPHKMTAASVDPRGRLGDAVAALEAAALRDALAQQRDRFTAVFTIQPAHNPVGPFDLDGAYDQASDRHQTLTELLQQGYDDARRQFLEPVVGASGEHLGLEAEGVRLTQSSQSEA
jgi:hypothetical protein